MYVVFAPLYAYKKNCVALMDCIFNPSLLPNPPVPKLLTLVHAGVIEALMARGRAGDGVYDDRIAAPSLVGLSGTLTAGPFSGFEGVCRMSTDQRVAVMITMFGREVKVEAARAEFKVQAA